MTLKPVMELHVFEVLAKIVYTIIPLFKMKKLVVFVEKH